MRLNAARIFFWNLNITAAFNFYSAVFDLLYLRIDFGRLSKGNLAVINDNIVMSLMNFKADSRVKLQKLFRPSVLISV